MPGHARRAVVQQLLAHVAPHAIGAQQRIAFDLLARHGGQRHRPAVVVQAGHPVVQVQVHAVLLQGGAAQQAVQIGAVDGGVRRAIALHGACAQRQRAQVGATGGVAHLQPVGEGGDGVQLVLQAPGAQDARHIRAKLHAGAHLGEFRRALEQANFPAGARHGQRGRQPADAATGNQQLQRGAHGADCAVRVATNC